MKGLLALGFLLTPLLMLIVWSWPRPLQLWWQVAPFLLWSPSLRGYEGVPPATLPSVPPVGATVPIALAAAKGEPVEVVGEFAFIFDEIEALGLTLTTERVDAHQLGGLGQGTCGLLPTPFLFSPASGGYPCFGHCTAPGPDNLPGSKW